MNSQDKTKMINLVDFSFDNSFRQLVDKDEGVLLKYFQFSWIFDNSRQATDNYVRDRD